MLRDAKQTKKSTAKHKHQYIENERINWWAVFAGVLLLTLVTRFYNVAEPDHVCWDETHFGKMGSWYINRTFFFDVHPPLGKMLIALSGYLTGYDGTFPFTAPGDKYNETNYIGMRVFCTALGAAVAPFAYVTVWEMTESLTAASLAAAFIIFDVGILTLTQYILLDPILLFFVMGSVMGIEKFHSYRNEAFSVRWWFWLSFTGTMLASATSVKFVGLFTVAYVGLRTAAQLWDILGDLSQPFGYTVKHFSARVLCLILLPCCLYMGYFYIHLKVLNRSGTGDGFYSSAFQAQLEGNELHGAVMVKDVVYGASITIKNRRVAGGYLHSHGHLYPEGVGARQQQITTYMHKDHNNVWIVKRYNSDNKSDSNEFVRHGDLIRLEHAITKRNLHAHRERAPITKKHYQVTGYGENGTGDANDIWQVVVVNKEDDNVLHTVRSTFKLIHYLQNCVLTATGSQLPKWAYEQLEVSCNPNLRDKNAMWNVEENQFSSDSLSRVSFKEWAPSFLESFLESHAVMVQGNSGLKPKSGEVTSRPWQWPINYRGQFFSGGSHRIYLLGNPIIWWANLVFLALFIALFIWEAVREQRRCPVSDPIVADHKRRLRYACGWLFLGWFLHYAPFWAMDRVLYFHHYFPALLFSSMLSGITVTYLVESVASFFPEMYGRTTFHILLGCVISCTVYSFYLFSPLAYGMDLPAQASNSSMHSLRWMTTWEF